MGFWTGVADYFGLRPVNNLTDFLANVGAVGTLGVLPANKKGVQWNHFLQGPVNAIGSGISSMIQDSVSTTMDGTLDAINTLRENGLGDYVGDMFQTDADAALDQAMTNDALSEAAWRRSEQSADAAQARARELRQTYYQDLMRSLKEAGLNPVLAASGGFGGVSSSAPMGTSQAATSQKADGLNAVNLIQAIAAILNGAGSLLGGVTRSSPAGIITRAGRIGF